jgi:hypothetical protein
VVDDEQWLDRASAQALAFVARRLDAESVGAVLTGPLDERVRDRIVAETRGNPLALLELPGGLTPAELAGGFALPGAVPLSGRIEESFRRRVDALAAQTRRLLRVGGGRSGERPAAGVAGSRAARDRDCGCPTASWTSSTRGTSPGRTPRTSTRRWSPAGGWRLRDRRIRGGTVIETARRSRPPVCIRGDGAGFDGDRSPAARTRTDASPAPEWASPSGGWS